MDPEFPQPNAASRNDNTVMAAADQSPREWIESLPSARRAGDGLRLLKIFGEATGDEATMWGPSIVGYGHHHYIYDTGREGDTCRVGFSPRASVISLYGLLGAPATELLLDRLGPYRMGKGCLYISSLARVDAQVLGDLVGAAWHRGDTNQPC